MPTSTRKSILTPQDAAISADSTLQLRLIWTALILGFAAKVLVPVETGPDRGYPGNGGPMASDWLPVVLEADFQSAKAAWTKADSERSSGINLSHGGRESKLGAPRIHGELLMLGFDVSERTISRWMKRAPRDPEQARRWRAFRRNHREAIAAMDFFTVPTLRFSMLYCFFVIGHDRRRILHFNVTKHPASMWIVQQLREAFPFESPPRFLISTGMASLVQRFRLWFGP